MAKFNAKQVSSVKTQTHEGGVGYVRNVNDALLNFLFGSYLEDQFYESAEEQQKRFIEILEQVAENEGYKFIGKLALFARNEMGMRSTSELAAAWLNDKPMDAKRDFYKGFFSRPDDVAEVFGAVDSLGQKRSHALVRGSKDYLGGLNEYSIGKYKMNGKTYNMYDLINITHAWSPAIQKYKDGVLESPETWEVKISTAENEEDKDSQWLELVKNRKLGYMALLRNLRNIFKSGTRAGWLTLDFLNDYLYSQLVNEVAIKKSKVFPYRIYAAYVSIQDYFYEINASIPTGLYASLDRAFRIAVGNMPELEGESLFILDVSGSMDSHFSENSIFTIKEISAVYCTAMYVQNPNSSFIKFGNHYREEKYPRYLNVFDIIHSMQRNDNCGYGTDIVPVFKKLEKDKMDFDRIFIFSDMQVMGNDNYWGTWRSNSSTSQVVQNYYDTIGRKVPIYSFDNGNYHSQIVPPTGMPFKYFTGLNENIMKFIELYENGSDIVSYINELYPY